MQKYIAVAVKFPLFTAVLSLLYAIVEGVMIKAEVRYESEHIKALFKLEDEKRRPVRIVILTIVALFCVAYTGISLFLIFASKKFDSTCFIYSSIAIVLWIFFIRRLLKNHRFFKEMNTMKPVKELRSFSFDDTMFRMICTREGFSIDYQINYSELVSAVETDRFFFITIEKGKTCIIGKLELTEGSPARLRTLLTEKLGGKFSVKD